MRMSKDLLDRQGVVLTPLGDGGDSVIKPSSSSQSTRSTASWTADLDGKAQQSMRGKIARTTLPLLMACATFAVVAWMAFSPNAALDEVSPDDIAATGEAAASAAATEKDANVRWFISSDPDGASIRVDGVEWAEKTPTSVILPRSPTPVEVVIEKSGYLPARARLAPVADQSFPYQLRAVTPPSQVLSMPRSSTGAREETKRAGASRKSSAKATPEATQETSGAEDSPLPPRQSRKFKPMPNFSADSQ